MPSGSYTSSVRPRYRDIKVLSLSVVIKIAKADEEHAECEQRAENGTLRNTNIKGGQGEEGFSEEMVQEPVREDIERTRRVLGVGYQQQKVDKSLVT